MWCSYGVTQQREFEHVKNILSHQMVLQFYDPRLPIEVSADASKHRQEAILQQKHGDEWKLVTCASRAITDTESQYAQR